MSVAILRWSTNAFITVGQHQFGLAILIAAAAEMAR